MLGSRQIRPPLFPQPYLPRPVREHRLALSLLLREILLEEVEDVRLGGPFVLGFHGHHYSDRFPPVGAFHKC